MSTDVYQPDHSRSHFQALTDLEANGAFAVHDITSQAAWARSDGVQVKTFHELVFEVRRNLAAIFFKVICPSKARMYAEICLGLAAQQLKEACPASSKPLSAAQQHETYISSKAHIFMLPSTGS